MSLRLLLLALLLAGTVSAQDAIPSPSPTASISLSIWWPDSFALSGENAVHPLLIEQSAAFAVSQADMTIEHRLKAVGATGGIMSTLRNASNVAPNALPSLTLLRRQDLVLAQREGLIRSLEGGIPSSIQGDLSKVLLLGQVNSELYGLPYLLDLQMMVYRPQSETDYSDWSYASVLARNESFVFAGGRSSGINDVLLMQYLSDGAELSSEGVLGMNDAALLHSFEFYQAAAESGIVGEASLNSSSPSNYLADFQNGLYDMGVFGSSSYLQLYQQDSRLAIAPIPTVSGSQTSLLNAWIWVLVTDEPREQALALDYIAWMMDSDRQAAFAAATYYLPSRQSSMALGLVGDAPLEPILQLLENPILPLSDSEIGTLGSDIQTAFGAILRGEIDAAKASQDILEQYTQ